MVLLWTVNWFVQRQNIFQIRLDEFTDLNPDSNSTRRYNYTKMFWRVTFQIGAKINCAQKIKTSGVWTEGKPEQLRPWFVRCKIQGELEGGGNCFWHWKDKSTVFSPVFLPIQLWRHFLWWLFLFELCILIILLWSTKIWNFNFVPKQVSPSFYFSLSRNVNSKL